MSPAVHDLATAAWIARLPLTKEDGQATGFDGRAFLADYLAAAAVSKAEEAYLGLGGFMAEGDRTLDDLAAYIGTCGMVLMEAWASTMALAGADREPWAREAANRAVKAYKDRLDDLMTASVAGGRA